MPNNINKHINQYIKIVNNNNSIKGAKLTKEALIDEIKEGCYNSFIKEALPYVDYHGKKLRNYISDLIEGYNIYYDYIESDKMDNDKENKLQSIIFYYYYIKLLESLLDSMNDHKNANLKELLLKYDMKYIYDNTEKKNEKLWAKIIKYEEQSEDETTNRKGSLLNQNSENFDETTDEEEDEEYVEPKYKGKKRMREEPKKEQSNKRQKVDKFMDKLHKCSITSSDKDIQDYYLKLSDEEQNENDKLLKEIKEYMTMDKPPVFKIMSMPLPLSQRNGILKQYNSLMSGRNNDNKLKTWFDSLMSIPFGMYKGVNLDSIKPKNVKNFLDNLQKVMDKAVYGHDDTKRQIIQLMGQQIRNPKSKGNMLGIWGPPGNGKCFLYNTPILMHSGKIKMVQDIKIGDVVMGDDSKPRNVLSLGSGVDMMYRIVPTRGEPYVVNSEHILCLKAVGMDRIIGNTVEYFNRKTFKIEKTEYKNNMDAVCYFEKLKLLDNVVEIEVKDYLKLPDEIKMNLRGYKVGVDFDSKDVFNPYIVGVWLASQMYNTHDLMCKDRLMEMYIRSRLEKYGIIFQYGNIISNREIFDMFLEQYGLNNMICIPDEYKINSRDNRLKVLAGLIDSSGYYNKNENNYNVIVDSERLMNDIMYLSRSLGFATFNEKIVKSSVYNGKEVTTTKYHIIIYGDNLKIIPTLYIRAKQPFKISNSEVLYKISVQEYGKDNYYGFTLDGNNRFILGDFSVTHNTTIIKEGIAKAMDKPFVFISLGGATDSSFLDGHSYTYEGSIYGRIMNGLITSKCMDPIIYFDELDKISKTHKGDEISNILVHLTDPAQNTHFRDKYFHGIDIDLSRVTMIFSFNDPSKVNPILLDRITTIETKYLLTSQKIHIAKNYLLPEMLKDVGLKENDIVIDDNIITNLIDNYTFEGGVRKLKSILYNVVREVNLSNLLNQQINNKFVTFPFKVLNEHIKVFLKNKVTVDPVKINNEAKMGVVNGLYAGSMGVGGILPIQILWIPVSTPLTLKATGYLQKVIKESTEVACTLAWNHLDDSMKDKYIKEWKDRPMGFHIHCGEGAIPKDGPSAGAALTIAIYSMLTNKKIRHDLAMTGEINLEGKVTAIGGLEEKLEGAKKAGVRLALIPRENEKHLEKIKERNNKLLDENFKVIIIENFDDVIKHSLI